MEKDKSVTPEDKATSFADENYPAKFADNKWDALYTAYHSGYLDGSLYERQQQFQKVMDGPYVDFDKPNIFMDGDNNSYSLMTSSDPEKREKGRQIRIHELVTRINQLEAERSELVGKLQARLERCRKVSGYSSGFSDIHNEIDFLDLLLNSLKK